MNNLKTTVFDFCKLIAPLTKAQLETPWAWNSYKGEGFRFGIFRVYEELLTLAAKLEGLGSSSEAGRIVGQYHTAFRDLQAVLWGVEDETGAMAPAEGEWPAQTTLAHIYQADQSFYTAITFALEQYAAGVKDITGPKEEDYDRILETTEDEWNETEHLPVSALLGRYIAHQARVVARFGSLADDLLDKQAVFWEEETYPIRFRLHRFTSHLKQHTLQIDRTLGAIGHGPGEAKSLVRLLHQGLAAVENAVRRMERGEEKAISGTVDVIRGYREELQKVIPGG